MDEPTSALDLHRQVEVLELHARASARSKGMIVLIAIHDLNQALRFADKVLRHRQRPHARLRHPRDVITAEMLREIYRVEARVEKCSLDHDHVIVDGTAH